MSYSVLLSMLQWWLLRSMAQDLATTKHTVFLKAALLISCMFEINVKQYNLTAGETSHCSSWIYFSILSFFQVVRLVKDKFPEEEIGCDLKVALYLAQLLSNAAGQVASRAAAPFTPPACLPGGRPLGQVSYFQDCSLYTPPPQRAHTHSKPFITVPVSQACNQYCPSDSMHTCDGRQKRRRGGGQQG